MVFTLGASGDRRRRPLLPERFAAEERALRRACLDSVLTAGRQAGCRLLVASPQPLDLADDVESIAQHGDSFGERLLSAIGQASQRVAGPLLVVGSDAPGLGVEHLRQALDHLRQDPDGIVLGPARDGGFYLLAADSQSSHLANLLADVRWCRSDTCRSVHAVLRRSGYQPAFLAGLGDLDHRADLEQWLAQRPMLALRRIAGRLRHLLASWRWFDGPPLAVALCRPVVSASGRAPPA